MLISVQAANWWTLCDQCGLSVIRSVILSVSRITAAVISRFHWNLVLLIVPTNRKNWLTFDGDLQGPRYRFQITFHFHHHCSIWNSRRFVIILIRSPASSSRMRVVNHNWSATKQRLYLQSAAKISCHSALSQTGFNNMGHRPSLAARTRISVCKSLFPSAGIAVSLFRAKMIH